MRNLSLFLEQFERLRLSSSDISTYVLTDEIQSSLVMVLLITSIGFTSISNYE